MSDHTLGSGPIQPEFVAGMNVIANALEAVFNERGRPKQVGFVLMTFNFSDTGRCNYISNAKREDIITLLTEQLAYFKGMPEHDPPVRPD